MATFDEHIIQAKSNLDFLNQIDSIKNHWDWKVTVAFYVAVHLANAHIAKIAGLHFRKHTDVNNALNPESKISTCKYSEEAYLAYYKLQNLSRRARYLCNENPRNIETKCFFTHDKLYARAVRYLDKLLQYTASQYGSSFNKTPVTCIEISASEPLNYFTKVST